MSQDNLKKIIHIDMDYFYAQVEEREDPSLKNIPVAVGGNPSRRGVICTSNYIARQYGVRSAMATHQALKKCPKLKIIHPNFKLYKAISSQIREIFLSYTEIIEPLSLDEAYLDVSHSNLHQGSATWIAKAIRQDIYDTVQLTASAGIGPNKFLAKVASDWKKPNGQFTVSPEKVDSFVRELEIKKIFGVGPVMQKKLHDMDIYTCLDLQALSESECIERFGKMGIALYDRARGIDNRVVNNNRIRKSLSVEKTFAEDIPNLITCEKALEDLYIEFLNRLDRIEDRRISSLFIKVKFHDFTHTTVEHVGQDLDIKHFKRLLAEGFHRGNKAVRLIGMGVKFQDPDKEQFEQLPLL